MQPPSQHGDLLVQAEHPAGALQGVLAQGAGQLHLAHLGQGGSGRLPSGWSGGPGRAPGGSAPACPRPGRGPARLAQPGQGAVRTAAAQRVVGWSGPSTRRQRCSVSSPRARAGSASPTTTRATVRSPAVRVIGWSGPSTRRQRSSVSSPRARAGPAPQLGRVVRAAAAHRVVGWSGPSTRRQRCQRVLAQGAGLLRLAQPFQGNAGLLAAVRVSGWSGPRTARQRSSTVRDGSAAGAVTVGPQIAGGVQHQLPAGGE